MMDENEFEPKLGRIRSKSVRRELGYLQRVLQSVASAGGRHAKPNRQFDGSRIGRGAGVGRVLRSRDRYSAFRIRRVIVQTRIVKLAGNGLAGARAHLRYIQRDGVTREGQPGALYDREQDKADGRAFIDRAEGDRHQFRFIVSAEDGAQYDDLKPFVRRLMGRMEKDLGTKLDWVAADHYNTGHPHSHIIVRGKDDMGRDLIISREYISYGMRERAAEIVSLDFGPRSDFEIQNRLRNEVEQDRFTSIDRDLIRSVDREGVVVAVGNDVFHQSLRAGRLQKLGRLDLAAEIVPGRWQLNANLKTTLQKMGERGDIIKTMHCELARGTVERAASDYAIYDPGDRSAGKTVGRVAAQGLSDELHERRYLIVEGVDGRAHYVDVGLTSPAELPPDGGVVAITPLRSSVKSSDRTIVEIAAAHDGQYSSALHAEHDPRASPEFLQSHARRLEVLRRAGVGIERTVEGTWRIAPDHLQLAERYERAQLRSRPVQVEMLSALPVERQIAAEGATWLDRELMSQSPTDLREAGFGREVREALDRRQRWLIAQGLAAEDGDRTVYAAGMISELQRGELSRAGAQLSSELGLPYSEIAKGERIDGIYKRRVDLASGRFAVIEKSREFTLAPWRPVLDENIGKQVSGIMRGDTISWTIGRQRSGPAI
jgi:type IV secretory pathway VirD2 relaxase